PAVAAARVGVPAGAGPTVGGQLPELAESLAVADRQPVHGRRRYRKVLTHNLVSTVPPSVIAAPPEPPAVETLSPADQARQGRPPGPWPTRRRFVHTRLSAPQWARDRRPVRAGASALAGRGLWPAGVGVVRPPPVGGGGGCGG